MSNIKDFADGLHQDVVSDIAESYFGARKNLEDMIKAYGQMVADFGFMVGKLTRAVAALHRLLLDEATAREFYAVLNVDPSRIPFPQDAEADKPVPVPFAFTLGKRYEKCVLRAYDRLRKVVDEYRNGRYFDDPDSPGRKRLTIHYLRLRALAGIINEEVHKVNDEISTTGILRYVKGMDPEQEEREQIMGGMSLTEGGDLDKDMFFASVDFEALNLPDVPELPALKDVEDVIRSFGRRVYAGNREAVVRVIEEMRSASAGKE
ncbi:MAG: hypothetical protein H0S80_02640 [Desulfovibrionaceae bacterium]|nr:hypothetical protein [Desulfovibrionaceae bacterium]